MLAEAAVGEDKLSTVTLSSNGSTNWTSVYMNSDTVSADLRSVHLEA